MVGPCDHEIVRFIDLKLEPPSDRECTDLKTSEVLRIRKGCVAETQERDRAVRCERAQGEPREAQRTQLRRGSEVRAQYRRLKRGLQANGMMPLLKNIVYLRHNKSIRNLISQVVWDLIPFCLIFLYRDRC